MSARKKLAELVGRTPAWRVAELFHKTPRVLFYHGVVNTPKVEHHVQANQIYFSDFQKQIAFLHRNFHFISIDKLYKSFYYNKPLSSKDIVLTFDDGYRNNLTVAAPLLKQYGIPFTVFISTNCVERGKRVPTYYVRSAVFEKEISTLDIPTIQKKFHLDSIKEREDCCNEIISIIKTRGQDVVNKILVDIENNISFDLRSRIDHKYESESILTWDEVDELQAYGATIGSHTCDHAILHSNQKRKEIFTQLQDSRNIIIQHVNQCNYFAFPNGDHDSICQLSLYQAGSIYPMSFIVDGKSINYDAPNSAISRIGMCDGFGAARCLFSLLSHK